MRHSPLNAALCLITKISGLWSSFVLLACEFCVSRQVGFSGRCFPDNYSLALEIQRIASINFRVSARLGRLAQSEIHLKAVKLQTGFAKIPSLIIKTMIHFGFLVFVFCLRIKAELILALVWRKSLKLKHNKAFKRDLARVAFLVCSFFSG
ncbi:hypothetical protein WFH67_03630 [Vibrio vulnificus]|uniref:hypothetical protein n=1 Tax=Vibrio vulnificus TaxID=672 RepID=UPI00307FBDB9